MGLRPLVGFKHQVPKVRRLNAETDGKFAALVARGTSNALIGGHVNDGVLHCGVLPCFDIYIIHYFLIDYNTFYVKFVGIRMHVHLN